MKLQINVPNTVNADSYTILYRTEEDLDWRVAATTPSMPYDIIGLDPTKPYYIKVTKNCKTKPCIPAGLPSRQWID